jgi:hypothetical protein
MTRKRWVTGTAAALMVLLVVALWAAIAADLGSHNDPLITVGYINELMPSLMRGLDERVAEKAGELNRQLDAQYREAAAALQAIISEFNQTHIHSVTGDAFVAAVAARVFELMGGGTLEGGGEIRSQRVELRNGQTLIGFIGTEFVLRIGSATVVGGTPGLIDLTSGAELNNNAALRINHLYMVTIDNVSPGQNANNTPRGLRATSNSVVFVTGPFIIQG